MPAHTLLLCVPCRPDLALRLLLQAKKQENQIILSHSFLLLVAKKRQLIIFKKKSIYSPPCETVLSTGYPIQGSLHVFEPPSRPDEVLLRRAGCAGISPAGKNAKGRSFALRGCRKAKTKPSNLAVIKTPSTSRIKRKASSLTKTG